MRKGGAEMRDRLIELIGEADSGCTKYVIADHLLANGVIVSPVKVGDIVFAKQKWDEFVTEYKVTNFFISQNKKGEWTKKYCAMKFYDGKTINWRLDFSFDEIGKTVFLTREEAENALAERRNRDAE
jgi:hypothetical protein